MKRKKVNFNFYLNDYGFSEADVNELKELLRDIPNVEVRRGIQFFPIANNIFFMIIVSGVLGGIAGGFLQAIGADIWNSFKNKLKSYLEKKKPHIVLEIRFKNYELHVPIYNKMRKINFKILDSLNDIERDIYNLVKSGKIPKDAFYLQSLIFLKDKKQWIVTAACDKKVRKDYKYDIKSEKWSFEYRELYIEEKNKKAANQRLHRIADKPGSR